MLHCAAASTAEEGAGAAVKFLLSHGRFNINEPNVVGEPPLLIAARTKGTSVELLSSLVEARADIGAKNDVR